jgi:hypothetical protein
VRFCTLAPVAPVSVWLRTSDALIRTLGGDDGPSVHERTAHRFTASR